MSRPHRIRVLLPPPAPLEAALVAAFSFRRWIRIRLVPTLWRVRAVHIGMAIPRFCAMHDIGSGDGLGVHGHGIDDGDAVFRPGERDTGCASPTEPSAYHLLPEVRSRARGAASIGGWSVGVEGWAAQDRHGPALVGFEVRGQEQVGRCACAVHLGCEMVRTRAGSMGWLGDRGCCCGDSAIEAFDKCGLGRMGGPATVACGVSRFRERWYPPCSTLLREWVSYGGSLLWVRGLAISSGLRKRNCC
jgi:hypothetical protein